MHHQNHRPTRGQFALLIVGLMFSSIACNLTAEDPTPSPMPPTPTKTPEPTNTPQPTSTPTPTATPDFGATANAEATRAVAAVIDEIDEELQEIGFSTDSGRFGWTNDRPLPITISAYNTYDLIPVASGKFFSDFVLKADVTWESSSGFIVCGFWFRAQGSDIDSEYYVFQTIRLSGLPAWDVEYWEFNQWKATISPGGNVINTPHLNQEQGSTNTFILAAEGNLLTVYANGHRLGKVTINSLSSGLIGLYGWQDSGNTTCTFDNLWVWELES